MNEIGSSRWHLYIIRTIQGSLYTGISTDVSRRFLQHQQGRGARALRGKLPLSLVWQCPVGSQSLALKLEYQIKQLSKKQKERLIEYQPTTLTQLWESRVFSELVIQQLKAANGAE